MKTPIPTMLLAATFAIVAPPMSADAPLVVAHRGASYDAPENTLASAKLAWEQNADAVETDIYLTKDGHIIVLHDKTTKRTTDRELTPAKSNFEELRKLDAGAWKAPRFAGEKLPTLEEQIALIPPGKRMFVEIKTGPEIVPALVRCLSKCGAGSHNITIISFNYDSLLAVREQLPGIPALYLASYKKPTPGKSSAKPQPTVDEIIKQTKDAKLTGLDLQSTWPLTPADVRKIKAAGLQLHVWTIDDPDEARRWIKLGAGSITTNRPGWMRQQLGLGKQ